MICSTEAAEAFAWLAISAFTRQIHVVAHALHHALVLHLERTLMSTNERQKRRDSRTALEVDQIAVAPLDGARLDAALLEQFDDSVRGRFGLDLEFEMEISTRIGDEPTA